MQLLIPTIGTRGDLQPYIALGIGLQKAGYSIVIASHPLFRELVESYGLKFAPIGPDINLGVEVARIRGNARSLDGGILRVMRFSFDMLEKAHPEILRLAEQSDGIIISHSGAGSIEADQLHLPSISVTLFPQAIPAKDPKQSIFVKALFGVIGAGMGLVMTRPLNQIRKRIGLEPMGPTGITSPILNLIPISTSVVHQNPFWEPRHRMTGFWFADTPQQWIPPQDLSDFLGSGETPVVISLGAMSLGHSEAAGLVDLLIRSIQKAGVRAIIQGFQETIQNRSLPHTIYSCGSIPHAWLLERTAALVHHGGFGTTAAGLQAGIPQLVIPFIIDQYMWGNLVAEKGVGPRPIARKDLNEDKLSDALRLLCQDLAMKETARKIGLTIQAEDGVGIAIRYINETGIFQGR
jgi:sterol 3beta-glucosyltransferase